MTTSSLQELALFIVIFFPALAIIVVCLRTYSRTITGQFGFDDALIIIAMVSQIANSSSMAFAQNMVGYVHR